jgi:molybdenum cofactor cytidylyltransferase
VTPGQGRCFALVPAAGRSQRMGQPKLLLPWRGGTIIEQVLAAWRASRVARVVVTVHPDDVELADVCRRAGLDVVVGQPPPPDMKASVRFGLAFLEAAECPTAADAWLVAPADMPLLSTEVIDRLIAAHDPARPRILVATHAGRRGHPVLLPWSCAADAAQLAPTAGLDQLIQSAGAELVECGEGAIAGDVDTPDDFRGLQSRHDRT